MSSRQHLSAIERRQGRELALQVLFQREFHSLLSSEEIFQLIEQKVEKQVSVWAQDLIDGVLGNLEPLDRAIQGVSQNWKISRMSFVDRNILRLSLFEMRFSPTPSKPEIAINEAVEIAKKYGSTESSAFVNGILDQLSKEMN